MVPSVIHTPKLEIWTWSLNLSPSYSVDQQILLSYHIYIFPLMWLITISINITLVRLPIICYLGDWLAMTFGETRSITWHPDFYELILGDWEDSGVIIEMNAFFQSSRLFSLKSVFHLSSKAIVWSCQHRGGSWNHQIRWNHSEKE